MVLDLKDNKDIEGAYVGTDKSDTNRVQQRWTIRYVDTMKTQVKGMGSMGNVQINRPFYIESQLWMGRVVYHHPNNHAYIHTRKDNEKRQMWIYDEGSKTIKSFYEVERNKDPKSHRSLDSRSGHITIQPTDSRYYQMWTLDNEGYLYTKKSRDHGHDNYMVVQGNHDSEGRAVYREHNK